MPPLAAFVSVPGRSDHTRSTFDKPSVSFSLDQTKVKFIPMLDELSEQELNDIYYSSDDFKMIKSKNKVLLRMMKTGRFDGRSDEYCFRGVELESHKYQRRARLQKVYATLFWENQQQRHEGVDKPTQLAQKIAEQTQESAKEALARAREDEEAVRDEKQRRQIICSRPSKIFLKPSLRRVAA